MQHFSSTWAGKETGSLSAWINSGQTTAELVYIYKGQQSHMTFIHNMATTFFPYMRQLQYIGQKNRKLNSAEENGMKNVTNQRLNSKSALLTGLLNRNTSIWQHVQSSEQEPVCVLSNFQDNWITYNNTPTSSVDSEDSEFSLLADCWSFPAAWLFSDSMLTSSSYTNKNAILTTSSKKDRYMYIILPSK